MRPQRGGAPLITAGPIGLGWRMNGRHVFQMGGPGLHAKLVLTRVGQTSNLHDAPFDSEDQQIHELDELTIDGDVSTTTCSYEDDTGRTVRFGQSSTTRCVSTSSPTIQWELSSAGSACDRGAEGNERRPSRRRRL